MLEVKTTESKVTIIYATGKKRAKRSRFPKLLTVRKEISSGIMGSRYRVIHVFKWFSLGVSVQSIDIPKEDAEKHDQCGQN